MKKTTRTMIILLALFVTSTIFISCNKKVPAFPQELTAYFPYTAGQELVFNDEEGNEMSFTINNVYISQEGSYKRCTKCGWWPYMEISGNSGLFVLMEVDKDILHILVFLLGQCSFEKEIKCHPYSNNAISEIGDTIKLVKDNGSELIIVREKGIVKYSIDNVTWNLVE